MDANKLVIEIMKSALDKIIKGGLDDLSEASLVAETALNSVELIEKSVGCSKASETRKTNDNLGMPCQCGRGTYKETQFFDDADGVLHCDFCGKTVERYF